MLPNLLANFTTSARHNLTRPATLQSPDHRSDVMPKTTARDLTNDLDELIAKPKYPGPRCGMTVILETISTESPELAERLIALIDSNVPATDIADKLLKNGYNADGFKVRRHRNRGTGNGCKCPR